ncbi:hypothetical protein, partial [Streptomyces europaeiscabiei]|uniref:hypothetical protein n=1 Tax=Streptomyces europaeiscabiei TaxID=146819 RepID=UPI0019697F6A
PRLTRPPARPAAAHGGGRPPQPVRTTVTTETVHACPPDGSGVTPCCGRTPFELPRTDRISSETAAITCAPAVSSRPGTEQEA